MQVTRVVGAGDGQRHLGDRLVAGPYPTCISRVK